MSIVKKIACFVVACVICNVAKAKDFDNSEAVMIMPQQLNATSQDFETYKIAKTTFLPELIDGLGFGNRDTINNNHNRGENCNSYKLNSCPDNGHCKKCPFGKKYILESCDGYYVKNGDLCQITDCRAYGSDYISAIPPQNVCTESKTQGSLYCYKNCRKANCSGYTIDCARISSISNVATYESCPECRDISLSNCGNNWCKITSCSNNMKINNEGTGCVQKDDTCPTSYFKTCETSTVGDPKYTEKGTACYQCKAKEPLTCAEWVKENYPSFSSYNGGSSLPSGNVLLTGNVTSTYTQNVAGKIVGPAYFDYEKCKQTTPPTIAVKYARGDGISLSGGLIANVNIEYDPVNYEPYGSSENNNFYSAVAGYGTLKDVKINSLKKDMVVVVYPANGDMTIEGIVNIYGGGNVTPLRIGDNAYASGYPSRAPAKLFINGVLDISSGRGLYYSNNAQITINSSGTLKISYGDWQGIFFNYAEEAKPLTINGRLEISSYGSGGKYHNDMEFTSNGRGKIFIKNGACVKIPNGTSEKTGVMQFESGAQVFISGSCKKASSSGSVTLSGEVTSLPGNFNTSCSGC